MDVVLEPGYLMSTETLFPSAGKAPQQEAIPESKGPAWVL